MKNKIIRSLSLWLFGNTKQRSIDMTIVCIGNFMTGVAFCVIFAAVTAAFFYIYFNLPALLQFP